MSLIDPTAFHSDDSPDQPLTPIIVFTWFCRSLTCTLTQTAHAAHWLALLPTGEACTCAGFLVVLRNRAAYQVLLTWQSWAAERNLLRRQLLSALGHWQHQALAAAFMRFRCCPASHAPSSCALPRARARADTRTHALMPAMDATSDAVSRLRMSNDVP